MTCRLVASCAVGFQGPSSSLACASHNAAKILLFTSCHKHVPVKGTEGNVIQPRDGGAQSNRITLKNAPKYFIPIKGPLQLILMDQNVRVWFDENKLPPGFLAQNVKNDVSLTSHFTSEWKKKKYQTPLRKGTFKTFYELQKWTHKEATNRDSSSSGIN